MNFLPSVSFASLARRALLAPLYSLLALGAAIAAPEKSTAPKTHTLYMGADFAVEWKGRLRPVQGVQGSSFVIDVDGQRVVVPADQTDLRIKMDDNLKLTTRSATVSHLAAERSYTAKNDPHAKFASATAYAMSATAASDVAAKDMRFAQANAGFTAANSFNGPGAAEVVADAQAKQAASESAYSDSLNASFSSSNNLTNAVSRLESELSEHNYDAFTLTAEVAAPESLANPYVVLVTRYREDEKAKAARLWIYAQALPRVGPEPEKLRVVRGGFPPGYQLEEVVLHLYDGRQEIATSIARKRVALTTDEAFQYSLVEYLVQHKGQTVSATAARAYWPKDLYERMASEKTGQTYYARVRPDGKITGLFNDQRCTEPITSPTLANAVPELRFYPALTKGKAVEDTVAIKL